MAPERDHTAAGQPRGSDLPPMKRFRRTVRKLMRDYPFVRLVVLIFSVWVAGAVFLQGRKLLASLSQVGGTPGAELAGFPLRRLSGGELAHQGMQADLRLL